MNVLKVTDDGMLSVNDFRSIHRAILTVLSQGPKKMYDLVQTIQNQYHEFKYIKIKIIANAIAELMKQNLVVSLYEVDF